MPVSPLILSAVTKRFGHFTAVDRLSIEVPDGQIIGYATLAIAIGINWMVSLALIAAVGIVAGLLLNLGGRWLATVVMLIITALVVQFFIWLFGVVL